MDFMVQIAKEISQKITSSILSSKVNFFKSFIIIVDFVVKSFASRNETLARAALMKIKNTNMSKGLDMMKLLNPYIDILA